MEDDGYRVCSRWIWFDERPTNKLAVALINIEDLEKADVIILDAWGIGPDSGGGMHFEVGYAAAKGKHVIVVGNAKGSYYALPNIHHTVGYEEARRKVKELCQA